MRRITACTVVTKSHLAYARALATSLAEYNPNSELFVLLADKVDGCFDPSSEPFHLIQIESLPDQVAIERMSFYYTPFELSCALRGLLHEQMLTRTNASSWVFLDADIMVRGSLEPIFDQLDRTSILLNPHLSAPMHASLVEPHEINLLRSGVFNAGFLGLRRTDQTRAFIRWFKERLEVYCLDDLTAGHPRRLFVDQLWLNLVPLFFDESALLLHPGANVAHWNLTRRTLGRDAASRVVVDGQPLLFVHFSGWDIANPSRVSRYASVPVDGSPIWEELAAAYSERLLAGGYAESIRYPYAFGVFDNQRPITPSNRVRYYNDLVNGTAPEGSPYAAYAHFYPSA